jgi:3'(2'), 5'-bisphosphate nucleotidase
MSGSRVGDATPDVLERLRFAAVAAREAGRRILRHYGRTEHETKAGGSPVTDADLEANAYLVEAIGREYAGEPVLAEESADPAARRGADHIWIVDPLDGTKEFLAGNGEFSVMIGWVARGKPVAGVVYLPAHGLLYAGGSGSGAWAEIDGARRELRCVPAKGGAVRLVGSRSHPDPLLVRMRDALGIDDVQPSGSVGIKCALIAEGERDLYIHPVPYLKEWDTCAPEAILTEAGGTVTDCLGAPLGYNKEKPSQPHGIVASGGDIHDDVLRTIIPLYEAGHGTAAAGGDNRDGSR